MAGSESRDVRYVGQPAKHVSKKDAWTYPRKLDVPNPGCTLSGAGRIIRDARKLSGWPVLRKLKRYM